MSMRDSAHRENMLSAASAAASSARRSEDLLRQLVAKDRAAILSEWIDRDMSVGNVIYKAGSVTIVDILDHAANEARKDQGEASRLSPTPETGLVEASLPQMLDKFAAHESESIAQHLEDLRNRLGKDGLSSDEWNALIGAASHLRIDARRRSQSALSNVLPDEV